MEKDKPLVSICCITYNHANYIRDAIEGFLMQKTTFPVEIIIHDDASTDNTANIVKEYSEKHPKLIKAILQSENQYSQGIKPFYKYIVPEVKGKYIALCEGDDYWTDPLKLQKQVDFLEENPDYGLVFTDSSILNQSSGNLKISYNKKFKKQIPTGNIFEWLLYNSPFATCTSLFRSKVLASYHYEFLKEKNYRMGDKALWLHIAVNFKVGYLPESTAVYRVLEQSASNFKSIDEYLEFSKESFELSKKFAKHYGLEFDHKKSENVLKRIKIKNIIKQGNFELLLKELSINPRLVSREIIIDLLVKKLF
jgi:glycosyltransferase involved in cell wall biosynthesis